ncbi:hypothetical protein [Engelhardtia mirabilis]|uniref:FecR protein n=1 Tax=Engelhardtia mirabilis TaxID=2528011 RepID=A0A518BGZ7_9BACT|nr:hypothetical protein Pla133_13260 [Planctomycetes bacterium Pla133]QDV00586.1 hypothetical protein Pla86_13250 [Planctomycetes bacterium Pla86]
MKLHAPSAVAGAFALVGILSLVAAAQLTQPGSALVKVDITRPLEVKPSPRDLVEIREGDSYLVPPGKRLVVTDLGVWLPISGVDQVHLMLEGADHFIVKPLPTTEVRSGMVHLNRGLIIDAGRVVTVRDSSESLQSAVFWGYLGDE